MNKDPRFMLISSKLKWDSFTTYVIVSSSDKVCTMVTGRALDYLILHGTVRPNNFGNCPKLLPERIILQLSPYASIEHHGYFRELRDVRDYIKMVEVLD